MLPVPYALNFLSADVRNLFGPFINVFMPETRHERANVRDSGALAVRGVPGE